MKKNTLNNPKNAAKGILTDSGRVEVLINISKVYHNRTSRKLFVSRWPPKPINDHNYVTIQSNLMNLVSIPRFKGAKNT